MRLLLDTNIILEVLLAQERAGEVQRLLEAAPQHHLFISDFSLHSIGLLLFRRAQHHVFEQLLTDLFENMGVSLLGLAADDMASVVAPAQRFALDFDDAYQYAVAERHQLSIVSFDAHFDRTARGRQTPAQALA